MIAHDLGMHRACVLVTASSGSGIDRLEGHAALGAGSRIFRPHLRVHRAGEFTRWNGARDSFFERNDRLAVPRKWLIRNLRFPEKGKLCYSEIVASDIPHRALWFLSTGTFQPA